MSRHKKPGHYSLRDAARILGVSPTTVYDRVRAAGLGRYHDLGRQHYDTLDLLDADIDFLRTYRPKAARMNRQQRLRLSLRSAGVPPAKYPVAFGVNRKAKGYNLARGAAAELAPRPLAGVLLRNPRPAFTRRMTLEEFQQAVFFVQQFGQDEDPILIIKEDVHAVDA